MPRRRADRAGDPTGEALEVIALFERLADAFDGRVGNMSRWCVQPPRMLADLDILSGPIRPLIEERAPH